MSARSAPGWGLRAARRESGENALVGMADVLNMIALKKNLDGNASANFSSSISNSCAVPTEMMMRVATARRLVTIDHLVRRTRRIV